MTPDPTKSHPPRGDAAASPDVTAGRRRLVLWTVGAAAAAGGAGWSWRSLSGGPDPVAAAAGPAASTADQLGDDFWRLTLPRPDDTPLRFEDWRGRPLLINFWATWCPPCVREMPLLDDWYRQHGPSGLQMVGVAVDAPTPVRAFLGRSPVGFPIVLAGAEGSNMARTLGNGPGGLPYTVLADGQGRIVARKIGELHPSDRPAWMARVGLAANNPV